MSLPIFSSPMSHRMSASRALAAILCCVALAGACAGQQDAGAAAAGGARQAFAQILPTVERSVVMVKVAAFPQVRVKGVIQPPRQFDLEGPATVLAPGVVVSTLSIFDPVKSYPPREGVEFSTTVYSKVEILVDGATWVEGRMAAMADAEDLVFFVPLNSADAARLPALTSLASAEVKVFDEYLDVTRAPAAFDRCAIARVTTITGALTSGAYIFSTSLSSGSPIVDAHGALLGIGVRVSSPGVPSSTAIMPAARVLAIAQDKGVLAGPPAPAP